MKKTLFAIAATVFAPAIANAGVGEAPIKAECDIPSPENDASDKAVQTCLSALDARDAALADMIAKADETAMQSLGNERKVNRFATEAVKAYADALAAWRKNTAAQKDATNRIEVLQAVAARALAIERDALAAVEGDETARLTVLRTDEATLREKVAKTRPPAINYISAVVASRTEPPESHSTPRTASPDCAKMIESPDPKLRVADCQVNAIGRFAGGAVQVPGSFLHPPGLSAFLSGSDDGGALSLSYAREFKRRLPIATTDTAQSFSHPGFSVGIATGDGKVFKSDSKKGFFDRFDSKLTLKAGLFWNFYDAQPAQEWRADADKMTADARNACLEDQAKESPSFRSTCKDQSLTDWAFSPDSDKGTLKHADLAKQVSALYFGSEDLIPRWGGGVEGSISRPSADYLRPGGFATYFTGSFDDSFESAALVKNRKVAWSVSPYLYRRLGGKGNTIQLVGVASFSVARTFGFEKDAEKTLYCPALVTSAPFSLGSCKSYFDSLPTDRMTYTPAGEFRLLFNGNGWRPTAAVSPKLSYAFGKATTNGDPDRWTLSVPALVFVDDEQKTGLGVQVDHSWGGTKLDGVANSLVDRDPETIVSLVVSKNFSLTKPK